MAQPAHEAGHDRVRADLRGLSYRTLHLQGHDRHHRRRTGAHQSLQSETGIRGVAAVDAMGAVPFRPLCRTYPRARRVVRRPQTAETPTRPGPETVWRGEKTRG